jgi:hypothetical protein
MYSGRPEQEIDEEITSFQEEFTKAFTNSMIGEGVGGNPGYLDSYALLLSYAQCTLVDPAEF